MVGKLARVKVAERKPKVLLSSYCAKAQLVQLTWSGPLRDREKLEGLSGVMAEKLHGGG